MAVTCRTRCNWWSNIQTACGSNYDATLANSFDAEYEMYFGSDAAVMIRESKAWMFKEVDSPLLGWEVYARRDAFYKETGIALVAGGSKQAALADKGAEEAAKALPPLYYAFAILPRQLRGSDRRRGRLHGFLRFGRQKGVGR